MALVKSHSKVFLQTFEFAIMPLGATGNDSTMQMITVIWEEAITAACKACTPHARA